MSKKSLIIYTDGSCIKKHIKDSTGPAGWAFCVLNLGVNEQEWRVAGGESDSTHNRMELLAVIEALKFCERENKFVINSDSQLTISCAEGKWKRNKNLDLWEEYDKFSKGKYIEYVKVKGHSGDKYNDIVDVLAREEAKKYVE